MNKTTETKEQKRERFARDKRKAEDAGVPFRWTPGAIRALDQAPKSQINSPGLYFTHLSGLLLRCIPGLLCSRVRSSAWNVRKPAESCAREDALRLLRDLFWFMRVDVTLELPAATVEELESVAGKQEVHSILASNAEKDENGSWLTRTNSNDVDSMYRLIAMSKLLKKKSFGAAPITVSNHLNFWEILVNLYVHNLNRVLADDLGPLGQVVDKFSDGREHGVKNIWIQGSRESKQQAASLIVEHVEKFSQNAVGYDSPLLLWPEGALSNGKTMGVLGVGAFQQSKAKGWSVRPSIIHFDEPEMGMGMRRFKRHWCSPSESVMDADGDGTNLLTSTMKLHESDQCFAFREVRYFEEEIGILEFTLEKFYSGKKRHPVTVTILPTERPISTESDDAYRQRVESIMRRTYLEKQRK